MPTNNRIFFKVCVLFGTRPEIIKLAPVIHELRRRGIPVSVVSSSQHTQILKPFLKMLNIDVDHDLKLMRPDQTLNSLCSRAIAKIDGILAVDKPDLILVQGDTTTALAGAMAGFNRGIKVGHVEAGLRSGSKFSPFPEEMNRRLISQIADLHFASTKQNRETLIKEGVKPRSIKVTGNPVIDSLLSIANTSQPSSKISSILDKTSGSKRVLLTTHRRESFGDIMLNNLGVLRDFINSHEDTSLLFPVHPNPNVRKATESIFKGSKRIFLLEPLDYKDFITVMKASWLIVSDSGGIQEEAPSLGKPLLVLRENTERPEALDAGIAKLVGNDSAKLEQLLESNYKDESWIRSIKLRKNPFGNGKASVKIVDFIERSYIS